MQAGDPLPSVKVQQISPDDALTSVDTAEIFKGKKAVLFGVPGAFTTACHKVSEVLLHMLSYVCIFVSLIFLDL